MPGDGIKLIVGSSLSPEYQTALEMENGFWVKAPNWVAVKTPISSLLFEVYDSLKDIE